MGVTVYRPRQIHAQYCPLRSHRSINVSICFLLQVTAVSLYVTGSGWALPRTCFGVHVHNTVRLEQPSITIFLNKLFISDIRQKNTGSGWALQCTCHGIYTHNTVPSRTTPTILIFPSVLCIRFQRATQPLLRGVQTREASVCKNLPLMHAGGCVALPVSTHCVYVYIPCVLIRLFCRHRGSVVTPINARSLTGVHQVLVMC